MKLRHTLSLPLLGLLGLIALGGMLLADRTCAQPAEETERPRRPRITEAVCVVYPVGDSAVSGVVRFKATRQQVTITGEISGLAPGKHGFHVHEFGDLTSQADGLSTGGHFNPEDAPHGAQHAHEHERHIGDLGNIEADANGVATFEIKDSLVRLNGPHSILGRAIIVHRDPDDYSQPVGNAGPRVGFGVIGIAKPSE